MNLCIFPVTAVYMYKAPGEGKIHLNNYKHSFFRPSLLLYIWGFKSNQSNAHKSWKDFGIIEICDSLNVDGLFLYQDVSSCDSTL